MNLVISVAPTDEPITLEEAKIQLRVESTFTDDDLYIERLIRAARAGAELRSLHALSPQTWKYYLDKFPAGDHIDMPKPPLKSVTSITYTIEAGDPASPTTLASTVYYVDINRTPGRIVLKPDQEWPTDTLYPTNAVCITYVCGYTAARDIPENARQWMFLQIADWYENREPVLMGQGNSAVVNPFWAGLLDDLRYSAVTW